MRSVLRICSSLICVLVLSPVPANSEMGGRRVANPSLQKSSVSVEVSGACRSVQSAHLRLYKECEKEKKESVLPIDMISRKVKCDLSEVGESELDLCSQSLNDKIEKVLPEEYSGPHILDH